MGPPSFFEMFWELRSHSHFEKTTLMLFERNIAFLLLFNKIQMLEFLSSAFLLFLLCCLGFKSVLILVQA
jgi:hypothetical protein